MTEKRSKPIEEMIEENYREKSELLARGMEAHLNFYHNHRERLIAGATGARAKAISHRGFHVGCAVLKVDFREGKYIYNAHCAANYTPEKKDPPAAGPNKFCAERLAIQEALDAGAKLIPAMVSVSKETGQTREANGGDPAVAHDVLHPCPDCRQMMRGLLALGVLRENSIICNVNDRDTRGLLRTHEQTVKDLLAMYPDDPPLPRFP